MSDSSIDELQPVFENDWVVSVEWRPIVDWENFYQVSNIGWVRSVERVVSRGDGQLRCGAYILRPSVDKHGRPAVQLCRDGKGVSRLVSHLVAEAFIGPRPDGLMVCHNDGNPSNNHSSNLRYDTRSANSLDAVRHGVHFPARMTECKRGHEFTSENTLIRANGRRCRICDASDQRRYQERKKAER